jgi:hypothetical protein
VTRTLFASSTKAFAGSFTGAGAGAAPPAELPAGGSALTVNCNELSEVLPESESTELIATNSPISGSGSEALFRDAMLPEPQACSVSANEATVKKYFMKFPLNRRNTESSYFFIGSRLSGR